jgi:hypothetical protein
LLLQLLRPRPSREKKEHSISSAEAKAAKAGSKVDKLHTKLVEATTGIAVLTPPGRSTAPAVFISPHSHSPKKCKGITGSPSTVHPPAVCHQLSPQQKTATATKRVSIQSPLRFPLRSPEDLSSSKSPMFSDNDKMLVGKVTNNKIETPFVAKDAKAKVVEDRKIAVAARKAISSAKATTAKAGSNVDKLCTKLAKATKGAAVLTPPGCGTAPAVFISPHSHSHKKCKGITGSPSSVRPPAVCPKLSLQQKTAAATKRVSIQSPLQFPLCSPEDLSSTERSTSSSGDDNEMLVGKDTNDKIETPFAGPAKCCDSLPQGTRSEAHKGCHYGSPLARGCVGLRPADRPVTSQALALQRCKFDDSLLPSNSSWMDNDSNVKGNANEIAFSNKEDDEGHATLTPVCPTTLFNNNRIPVSCQMERDVASILDRIWPGSHNITILTCFVACHFAGDWNSYLPFAHWMDCQSLKNPSSSI